MVIAYFRFQQENRLAGPCYNIAPTTHHNNKNSLQSQEFGRRRVKDKFLLLVLVT